MPLPYVEFWLKKITKRALQATNFAAFKAMVLMLMFIGLFRKRTIEPTAMIFSLSYEQVFQHSSPKGVISFFKEGRFTSKINVSKPIIEVRDFKTIWRNYPEVTYDVAIYIY